MDKPPSPRNPFQDGWTVADVNAVIGKNDPAELLYAPLVVSMNPPSRVYAEQICLKFATHPDPNVRGLAMEGFGNIARIFRSLNKRLIAPVIEAGLKDHDEWVRGKVEDSAEEIEWYIGWVFPSREDRRANPTCPRSRREEL